MTTPVIVTCPHCSTRMKLKTRESLGVQRACPKCAKSFTPAEDKGWPAGNASANQPRETQPSEQSARKPQPARSNRKAIQRADKPKSGGNAVLMGLGAGGLLATGIAIAWFVFGAKPDQPDPEGQAQNESKTDKSEPPVTSKPTIDLLAKVDPSTAQSGDWSRDGMAIVSKGNGILPLGHAPAGGYRATVKFTREVGNQQVNLILPVPGEERQFLLVIDWQGRGDHGIETLRGQTPGRGNASNNHTVPFETGKQSHVDVEVRASGEAASVRAELNEQQLFDWSGKKTDLNNPYWATDDKRVFGLGSGSGSGSELVIRYDQFVISPIGNGSSVDPIIAANNTSPGGNPTPSNPPTVNPARPTPQPKPPAPTPPAPNPNPNPTPVPTPNPTPPRPNPTPKMAANPTGERWTQFRGSNFGHTSQTGLPTKWSETENIEWKADLGGRGGSSPIVVGNQVFVTSYSGYGLSKQNPGDINQLVRHLVCIDRGTGNVMWTKSLQSLREPFEYKSFLHLHGYASSTPCSDGQRVFVQFGNSGVYAFDVSTGDQVWHKDIGNKISGFGSGASPAIISGMLIVNASIESQKLLALKPEDGSEIWQSELGGAYTTPVMVQAAGRNELVLASGYDGRGIVGFNAADGSELWTWRGQKSNRYICGSPIIHNGVIYGTGSVDGPLAAIRPGGSGDVTSSHQVWKGSPYKTDVTSPVFHNGKVYWIGGGRSVVFDASSGDVLAQIRTPGGSFYASPLISENRFYIPSHFEGVFIFEANAELTQVANNVIREPGSQDNWNASIVPDQGRLLLRSPTTLYCIGN